MELEQAAIDARLTSILQDSFGLQEFRSGQYDVISRLVSDKNVAAVFPTGGGKSLCYQLPSQLFDGTTVVVSPLIALMKDQCDALEAKGIKATRLDSTLSGAQYREAMSDVRSGQSKILYIAPERFFNERFLASIDQLDISLFAIDEAHCISQWGHNFRPDYLKLAELTKDLSAKRVLALTATATPEVLTDICDAFAIQDDDAIRTDFYRPNLSIRSQIVDDHDHYPALARCIRDRPRGPTLVYVSKQATAEEVAERLESDGFLATAYHAGMQDEDRARIQAEFLASKDGIIVATIAFGMGIDKPNIRYVYHFNPPKSLEAYAQEIGRAGRDGEPAICEMILWPKDRIVLENFTYGDTPSRHAVGRMIDLLFGQPDEFFLSHYKLSSETDIRILVVRTLLTYLQLEGFIKSTSPRYDSYKVQPHVASQTILSHFDGERRQFIADVLGSLTKGRTWFSLNMPVTAKRTGSPRERIVKAVEYMAERGWIEVKVSDLVHGYRWVNRPQHPKLIADDLFQRLSKREDQEVARLDQVLQIATASSCQAADLSAHFGENLPEPCGHCSACLGDGPMELPVEPTRSIGTSANKVISEIAHEYPDHFTTPRDKARFLCGLSSPAFVRARLTRNPSFGICQSMPFVDVLTEMESES